MAKKNITIDDLAVMVQKGFNGVDKRFDGVDKRFDEMVTKSEMNRRFDLVDKRFEKIENLILIDHKKRIERLEAEVKDLREMFAV